jgi:diguanylate cyclase (GGDEF)-like protein
MLSGRNPKATRIGPIVPREPHGSLIPEELAVIEKGMLRVFLAACCLCAAITLIATTLLAGIDVVPRPVLVGFHAIMLWSLVVSVYANHRLYRFALRVKVALLEKTFMDEPTGVFNFTYLNQRLMEEYERIHRYGGSAAVLFIDLDHFKEVNDRHGHLVGNLVLREVATALSQQVRACDVFGRVGGDEFMTLLPHTGLAQAEAIAERLRQSVERHSVDLAKGRKVDFVRVSIGVAVYPDNADSMEGVVTAADHAVYGAKKLGGNKVCASSEFIAREAVGDTATRMTEQ